MDTNINKMATVDKDLTGLLANSGIELDVSKVKTARRNLTRVGAANVNLSDEVAVAADRINDYLSRSENNIKSACYIAGAFRLAETWKTQKDDNGKPYKSENAFLKSILPGFATSTVTLYCDVGATIYIPAANGDLKDLPGIGDLSPSNAKFLLNAIKDSDKRKRLPAALKEASDNNNGKLTQKAITSAVKSLNDSNVNPESGSASSGAIADELTGGGISVTLSKLISFAYNGDDDSKGDLTALVIERDVKDFMSLLLKARNDNDTALAVCDTLYNLAKKAK